MSYFTIAGHAVRDAVQHVGPGALLQQEGVHAPPASTPNKPPTTLDEVRAAAEKLKSSGVVRRRSGCKTDPFVEHWTAMAASLFVNNSNGRKARATKSVVQHHDRRTVFTWLTAW